MPFTPIGPGGFGSPAGDPLAVKKFSAFLAVDVPRKSYFGRSMIGKGSAESMPIMQLDDLETDAGDLISFDLNMQMTMMPIEGDLNPLEGNEARLEFHTDSLFIDQARAGINSGGRMTRKRTVHNLRLLAKRRQVDYWARLFDEMIFMYLSGGIGVMPEYIFDDLTTATPYPGFANNPFTAPDFPEHHLFSIAALGTAPLTEDAITAADTMTLAIIDRAKTHAEMMGGGATGVPQIQPVMINGEEHYVCVMSPWQAHDMRTDTGTGEWLDVQKAAAAAEGSKNRIFRGSLGMYNEVVLHSHKAVMRYDDLGLRLGSGVATTISGARALFLGEQAGVIAFGSPGNGFHFDWHEESDDRGNQLIIDSGTIFGIKKTTFNGLDFGVIAIDTAAARP